MICGFGQKSAQTNTNMSTYTNYRDITQINQSKSPILFIRASPASVSSSQRRHMPEAATSTPMTYSHCRLKDKAENDDSQERWLPTRPSLPGVLVKMARTPLGDVGGCVPFAACVGNRESIRRYPGMRLAALGRRISVDRERTGGFLYCVEYVHIRETLLREVRGGLVPGYSVLRQ